MADRKQRERIAEKRLSLFSFHSIWVTSLWDGPSHMQGGTSPLFSLWKCPHRYTKSWSFLILYVLLNLIKLTIKINHHNYHTVIGGNQD
jgi:hypothetical protein